MGYRLHFVQHYAPEYQGGYFNHDYSGFIRMFDERFAENGYKAENEDIFEVEREDVKAYIAELHKLKPADFNEYFPDKPEEDWGAGYTNEDIIGILQEILTSDDDTIRLEFF